MIVIKAIVELKMPLGGGQHIKRPPKLQVRCNAKINMFLPLGGASLDGSLQLKLDRVK